MGPPPVLSARRRWLAAAWLAACAAVIGPLSAELALVVRRASVRGQADRHRAANVFEQGREVREAAGDTLWQHAGVSYRPGARLSLVVGGEPYEIVINSHGFRSPEVAMAKRPGVLRVACIGGSTTVQGRTNDETYPAFLERKLRAALPGREIEVLNLGINGVTSDHWLTRQDELWRFQPDVIVQYEFVNDIFFRHLPRFADDHAGWTRARRSLLVASFAPPSPDDLEPYLRRTLRNLREMADAAEARGARHVVGTFAGPDAVRATRSFRAYLDLNIESWGGRHGVRSYSAYDSLRRDFNARLRKAAGEGRLDLAEVDLRLTDPVAYVDLCHLNAGGIEAMAEAFLPAVTRALHE